MPKSTDDDYLEMMQFESITEFVEILHLRQKTLNNQIKKTKTLGLRQRYGDRIDEVDHFIELIKHSNLTCRDKAGKDTRLAKPPRKTSAIPDKKKDIFLPSRKKAAASNTSAGKPLSSTQKLKAGKEPKEGSKKARILAYIRQHQEVTIKQIVGALHFESSSVSAHISALRSQKLVERKAEGLWEAIVN